jgi:hypothetical protein
MTDVSNAKVSNNESDEYNNVEERRKTIEAVGFDQGLRLSDSAG